MKSTLIYMHFFVILFSKGEECFIVVRKKNEFRILQTFDRNSIHLREIRELNKIRFIEIKMD